MRSSLKKWNVYKLLFTVVLFVMGITMLAPLIWMISTSFKAENEVFNFPIEWLPKTFVGWKNYQEVWGERSLLKR